MNAETREIDKNYFKLEEYSFEHKTKNGLKHGLKKKNNSART